MITRTPAFRSTREPVNRSNRGAILIIVLWIVFGLVALTLYFADSMKSQLHVGDNILRNASAYAAIDGAARYATVVLTAFASEGEPPLSTDYTAEEILIGEVTCWFIGREVDLEPDQNPVFGFIDEASKINLNTATLAMLEALPEMPPEFAAAIIDWRDTNTETTEQGAEDNAYASLDPPRLPKNGPFETVGELRLVYNSTLHLLLGEDTNRNGALDANEDDASLAYPSDDSNGVMRPSLLDLVTVYSRQPNTNSEGDDRLNVTTTAARPRLQQLLASALSESRATEIISGLGGRPIRSVAEFMIRGNFTAAEFETIESQLTASEGDYAEGLVNVNTAPAAVLACLPGIGVEHAATVVNYRLSYPDGLTSIAWLAEVLADDAIVAAGPFITGQSYQYSADIAAVGAFGRGYARSRFVFDLSDGPPRIIFREDLTGLGWALGPTVRANFASSSTRS